MIARTWAANFSLVFPEYHSENDDQQSDQEHEDRNPVDCIHISNPAVCRLIRILFPDIQILCQLS
jgi:hypothetical protein